MQAILIVLPIFLIIAFGWLLRQKGFFTPQTMKENNSLLYCFAMPALLFRGILRAESRIPNAGLFTLTVCRCNNPKIREQNYYGYRRWGNSLQKPDTIHLSFFSQEEYPIVKSLGMTSIVLLKNPDKASDSG